MLQPLDMNSSKGNNKIMCFGSKKNEKIVKLKLKHLLWKSIQKIKHG
jgi:hypothetical protein